MADTRQVPIALPRYVAYHPIGRALDDYLQDADAVALTFSMRPCTPQPWGERTNDHQVIYTQYAATIPRRRSGETGHEDQSRGPIMPGDNLTLA